MTLEDIKLPYIVPNKLLMTEGVWNQTKFPASSIAAEAKRLASDPNASVRLCVGASRDHEDSTGTLCGDVRNFIWDGKTLYGDLYFVKEEPARMAKYQVETGAKLEGISPRMDTIPHPDGNAIKEIVEFKSFGVVLDPAQGDQAMLAKDGKVKLDDGGDKTLETEDGENKIEEVTQTLEKELAKQMFCAKCDKLFKDGTEKCSSCGAELKEADAATIARLKEGAKKTEVKKEEKKEEVKEEKTEVTEEAKVEETKEPEAKKEDVKVQKETYPNPTHKERPFYRKGGATMSRKPYYAKDGGSFHKGSIAKPFYFSRPLALDQVRDEKELASDIAGVCGEIVKFEKMGVLDVEKALVDLMNIIAEIPQATELARKEIDVEPFVIELLKGKRDAEAKVLKDEVDRIEAAGKTTPAMRDYVEMILATPSDAVLSEEGKNVDVAEALRKVIELLPEGASMTLDEKTQRLVAKEQKLSEDKSAEERHAKGADSVPVNMRNETETE